MTKEELNKILEKHLHWWREDCDGWENMRANLSRANLSRADLSRAGLSGADLSGANLSGANLSRANLSRADLSGANLSGANLSGANLSGANLSRANLSGANLSRADLSGAYLSGADLSEADLSRADLYRAYLPGANLYRANLSGAYHMDEATGLFLPAICPSDGEFIGWKKCRNDTVVKLLIPDNALRSSASGRKCRASEAVVLTIYDKDGKEIEETNSLHDIGFVYRVGETVKPGEEFDTNRWNECAPGIHFFITREEAERYNI